MLSTTIFTSIIADECLSEDCNIKYIPDNTALNQQCKKHLEFDISYLNMTFRAEYNIIE